MSFEPPDSHVSLELLGRACAVGSSLACASLVLCLAWFNPYVSNDPGLNVPMGLLLALAVLAAAAGVGRQAGLLIIAFALSFVPMGLYLLGTPGIFAGIGVAHLGYLLAAALIMLSRQRGRIFRGR